MALAGAVGKSSDAADRGANPGNPSSGGTEVRATRWMSTAAGAQDGRKAAYLPFSGELVALDLDLTALTCHGVSVLQQYTSFELCGCECQHANSQVHCDIVQEDRWTAWVNA